MRLKKKKSQTFVFFVFFFYDLQADLQIRDLFYINYISVFSFRSIHLIRVHFLIYYG